MYTDERGYAARALRRAIRQRCRLTSAQSSLPHLAQPLERTRPTSNSREDELVDLIDFSRCFRRLHPRQQILLDYHFVAGHTQRVCARLVHRSLRSTVRDISEALAALAVLLADSGLR